jgi:hypothetical protein
LNANGFNSKQANSFPLNIINVRDIKDVIDNYKDKMSHFLIKLDDGSMHLKCDNYDVKNEWLKAIQFMREKFKASYFFNQRKYKEAIDDETSMRIRAENEWSNWESLQVGFMVL